jgi:hypothetical protein
MKTDSVILLRPRVPRPAVEWFNSFRQELRQCDRRSAPLLDVLNRAQEDLPDLGLCDPDQLTVQLLLEVLQDLVSQRWLLDSDDEGIVVLPPDAIRGPGVEQQEVKQRLRTSLVEARNEQLRDPGVKKFIAKMERPRLWGGSHRSVLDLFTAPQSLAADLRNRLSAPPELRHELLRRAVQPYLQRVTEERDEHTGLRLRDVWRYCRYSWSLPYNSQPGRRLHFLVRDAARPGHPIMGIAALGNSMVQITSRDDEIGWTMKALRNAPDLDSRLEALHLTIARAVDNIYVDDFLKEGLLTPDDLANPSDGALANLERAGEEAGRASVYQDASEEEDLERAARSPRYRRKRAIALRKWLQARRLFSIGEKEGSRNRLFTTAEGRRALNTALRLAKQRRVGTSMMDITTCGAIPPYGPVLGGKLTALLIASPQVVATYRAQYAGAESHIASRMSGRCVVRPPDLVLLCTTSLYYVGSSQYNRLRAPTCNGEVRYHHVGETLGYGSVHLSRRTYETLQRLLASHPGLERQSHQFAAGVNYKLRSIAAGLNFLGLSPLQKHKSPRLVYVIPLAANWREVLTGAHDEPDWVYHDVQSGDIETQALIDFWKDRWFIPRVQRPEVLRALENLPTRVRLSEASRAHQSNRDNGSRERGRNKNLMTVRRHMATQPTVPWTTLAEFVGERASFAERLTTDELDVLHVRTRIDQGLKDAVVAGFRIYLSGNPGDGKTHIIRRCEPELEGVFINLDASATDEARLVGDLNAAIDTGESAVLAVNEGPLRKLRLRLHAPDREELDRQLDAPFVYGPNEESSSKAILVNLGVRQVLERSVVDGVLQVVLNRVNYDSAPRAVRDNHVALTQERVQSRLFSLLEFAAQGGTHVTMHQVVGFFAFIVTGGGRAETAERIRPYFDLVFCQDNPLYGVLRDLDPAVVTHPMVDMQLWDSPLGASDEWLTTPFEEPPRFATTPGDALSRFRALKRQYFFEARNGGGLLEMLPNERRSFHDLLARVSEGGEDSAKQDLLDLLGTFFGHQMRAGQAELPAWTGLRYNALGQPTALVANSEQTVRTSDLELLVPRLRKEAADLVEFVPNHVRLRLRHYPEVSLDVDLALWLELQAVQGGLPAQFRDPAMAGRVERFLAAVAHRTRGSSTGHARLFVRDVEGRRTHVVEVALERGTYRL